MSCIKVLAIDGVGVAGRLPTAALFHQSSQAPTVNYCWPLDPVPDEAALSLRDHTKAPPELSADHMYALSSTLIACINIVSMG